MVRVEAMIHELLDTLGIKAPVVVAGLSGGILRALSRHRYKVREMVASPICGALGGGVPDASGGAIFPCHRPVCSVGRR